MDQYLARWFAERSRREWKEVLKAGRLRLDGRVVRASDPAPGEGQLPSGSTGGGETGSTSAGARLEFLDSRGCWTALLATGATGATGAGEAAEYGASRFWSLRRNLVKPEAGQLSGRVVYQDSCLLAMDKPAGMPSHPLAWDEPGLTMADLGLAVLKGQDRKEQAMEDRGMKAQDLPFPGPQREAGLVHRLDNDTSGILLFCTDPQAWPGLLPQFRAAGEPESQSGPGTGAAKTYLALVLGREPQDRTISYPLAHHRENPRIMTAPGSPCLDHPGRGESRPASSQLKVLARAQVGGGTWLSLVEVVIHRGQHHQIRAHCAACGFPLLGDVLYGGSTHLFWKERELHIERHLLHAWKLAFRHPLDGRPMELVAPLSPGMQEILDLLAWDSVLPG